MTGFPADVKTAGPIFRTRGDHHVAKDRAHAEILDEPEEKLKAFQKRTHDPWILKWDYE